MTQHIRISQFVVTYGPGAILESISGPRIIPRPDFGLFGANSRLKNIGEFEITDRKMTSVLLNGARIFRLPSNAELGYEQDRYVYRTKPFPDWKLCLNMSKHGGSFYILHRDKGCPICGVTERKRQEPIRFIVACPEGHMDDFDWNYFVHIKNSECKGSGYFRWYGGGGSLSKITLECPNCLTKSDNFGSAYQKRWPCSGRFPEREPLNSGPNRLGGCNSQARIIQRQASNLRIPELRTLLSISTYTKLHKLLCKPPIYHSLVSRLPASKEELSSYLNNLAKMKLVAQSVVSEILQYPWEEIQQAIAEVQQEASGTYADLIREEFHALIDASQRGVPPVRKNPPHSPVIFHVDPNLVQKFNGPEGTSFRVTPILRLNAITVQIGYRREVDTQTPAKRVDVGFPDPDNPEQSWYPGVELFGEGIFIMLDGGGRNFRLKGEAFRAWEAVYSTGEYPKDLFRDEKHHDELHPLFVWWHTLSHTLIRTVSNEAGYSLSSIRERVYFESNDRGELGGILLYATQAGTEGTLGGLIALVPYFQDMLDLAFDQLSTCSLDPLCIEQKFVSGKYNGAACYGCLLLSETSCEHRNMWLDRNVLLENLP